MIIDPTALFALALCIGILGLLVLILPLMILFWSQMEPQLVGIMSVGGGTVDQEDEYASQAVLPRLMKSFGDLAAQKATGSGKKSGLAPKSKSPSGRKPSTQSRSKASSAQKTVKAAPLKVKKTATAKSAAAKRKPKSETAAKAKPAAKGASKVKSKPASRGKVGKTAKPVGRTPAGAKRDPNLGVVYTKKPKEIDDLKGIKGVAKVIEGKLHSAGVYTFRQIVDWDEAMIDAFSEKLSFKGRIRIEGWQVQCAKFYKEKYGEKIG